MTASTKGGKRSAVVIRTKLRKKFNIKEASSVLVEGGPDGVAIPPGVKVPKEVWSPKRKAAFLLGNAVDLEGYEWARREVRRMGLDPDRIPHGKPKA